MYCMWAVSYVLSLREAKRLACKERCPKETIAPTTSPKGRATTRQAGSTTRAEGVAPIVL